MWNLDHIRAGDLSKVQSAIDELNGIGQGYLSVDDLRGSLMRGIETQQRLFEEVIPRYHKPSDIAYLARLDQYHAALVRGDEVVLPRDITHNGEVRIPKP